MLSSFRVIQINEDFLFYKSFQINFTNSLQYMVQHNFNYFGIKLVFKEPLNLYT